MSFASQQRRAINLIWALGQTPALLADASLKIAVIGGGIAGLTAAAALLCRNYSVKLFEREGGVLRLQSNAHHRLVHPTINFWPEEELAWTTELPFLDWYAADSAKTICMIEKDWQGFSNAHGSHPGLIGSLVDCCPNRGMHSFEAGSDNVVVTFDDGTTEIFDRVFVTTGFGIERNLGDTEQKPYWRPDEIDTLCLRDGFRIAVSGTGDGGVIDALRATYPKFMLDEIALKIIHFEERLALRKQIVEVELAAERLLGDLDQLSVYYHERYSELASQLTERTRALLPQLRPRKIPVTLFGERAAPYDFGVAPIHKLILAYTLNERRIEFKQGKLTRGRKIWYLTDPVGQKRRVDYDHVVVRHGTEPPADAFLGTASSTELMALQRLLGDFLPSGFANVEQHFCNPRIYPDRSTSEFAVRRWEFARELALERFGLNVVVRDLDRGRPRFEGQPLAGATKKFEQIPEHIFGVPFGTQASTSRLIDPLIGPER